MYAQVNRFRLHVDTIEEGLARWRDGLAVAYSAQPGFRGATLLSDMANGGGAALLLLLWDSIAVAEEGNRSAAVQEALIPFQPLFDGDVENDDYTVRYDERFTPSA